MGDRLCGRYTDPVLLFPDGTVDYRKVQDTERFREGIGRLLAIISSGKTIALMCAEKEPERCHRFVLISPVLQSKGISVVHVRPKGKLQANEDLEQELVDSFFDTLQVSISGEPVDFVGLMYERINREITFKREDTKFENR
jgi:pimeloyl-ACP methyl ester carboxylesterase